MQKDEWRWLTKPFLMPVLLLVVCISVQRPAARPVVLILTALFFSGCGDVLLQANGFFLPGLFTFLLAHIFYIIYFFQIGRARKAFLQVHPSLPIAVLLYLLLLLAFLLPHLGPMTVPVIFYSLTIGTMLLMALQTRRQIAPVISRYFLAGALLFVLSDSVLAVNLFVLKQWQLGSVVMATYAVAQYLIVTGALRYNKSK